MVRKYSQTLVAYSRIVIFSIAESRCSVPRKDSQTLCIATWAMLLTHRWRAGDLIGINTAIYSPSGANSGVGFAIPVDTVKDSVTEIIANGRVVRPVLGIAFAPDSSTSQLGVNGILVLSVKDGGPASKVCTGSISHYSPYVCTAFRSSRTYLTDPAATMLCPRA